MTIGLIILFNDSIDSSIELFDLLDFMRNRKHIKVCIVDNISRNSYLRALIGDVEELHNDLVVLDTKRNLPEKAALKAGVRLIKSKFNIDFIYFTNYETLSQSSSEIKNLFSNEHVYSENQISNHNQNKIGNSKLLD